jgi:hypothetical protein
MSLRFFHWHFHNEHTNTDGDGQEIEACLNSDLFGMFLTFSFFLSFCDAPLDATLKQSKQSMTPYVRD